MPLIQFRWNGQIDTFLKIHKLTKLLNKKTEQLLSITEVKIKNNPPKKTAGPCIFTGKFWKIYEEEIRAVLHKFFQGIKMQVIFLKSFFEVLLWY